MDFQITIKQKEREAVEKATPKIREEAIAEATPKIRAEAVAEAAPKIRAEAIAEVTPKITAAVEKRTLENLLTRMLEDGSLSDEQIMSITGATAQELENCKCAASKN